MSVIHAAHALTPAGWQPDVRITLDGSLIAAVEPGPPEAGDDRQTVVVAGLPNLHSHAFQRAMAGASEYRSASRDSFWTWREAMYRVALSVDPDDAGAIAAQTYMEMLEAGFTRVGEFHYLHHDKDGAAYGDIAEMAGRIAEAAGRTGIGLTLLPVFYGHSGFGGSQPEAGQRRFISRIDDFATLVEGCRAAITPLASAALGIAPHSLRAVTPDELSALSDLAPGAPMHIHAAEQTAEVEACLAWSGARPVEWLLDNASIDARWCIIHATHMTDDETRRLAESGATAGLCPLTEANLGDGVFSASSFVEHGGRFGIGSDSNVMIDAAGELRQLEYTQRLARRERNVLASARHSTGRTLFESALAGGHRALGAGNAGIETGTQADMVSLSPRHPVLAEANGDAILDGWIFAGSFDVDCVWAGGVKQVEAGRHRAHETICRRFDDTLKKLASE